MKTVLITLSILLCSLVMKGQSDQLAAVNTTESGGVNITVTVSVPSEKGSVIVGLFDEQTFMKAAPLKGLDVAIVDGKATATFENVNPGVYAISLFHDKNGNKLMDFEPNGMPMEMYGVSNNPMSYGPPKWSEAKFELQDESIEMNIRL